MRKMLAPLLAVSLHVLMLGIMIWAMQPALPEVPEEQVIMQVMIAEPPPPAPLPMQVPVRPKPISVKPKTIVSPKKEVMKPAAPAIIHKEPAAVAPKPSAAIVTQAVFNAAYLQNPPPVYPPAARKRGIEGKVLLHVEVSAEGRVAKVMLHQSSGSSLLDEAAKKAVAEWRFVPAKRNNEPISTIVIVPVVFRIT